MTPLSEKREDELIRAIADTLGHSLGRIRVQCEQMRGDFRVTLEDEIGATIKRDKLLKIKKTCLEAAKAVGWAPKDVEWRGEIELGGRQFEVTLGGSTEISMQLWALSELAGKAAKALVLPKARVVPKKDLCALYNRMLHSEFPPRARSQRRILKRATVSNGRGYIEARWAYLSPQFRIAHNRLRQARGLTPFPPPGIDFYAPSRKACRSEFREPSLTPNGPYLKTAPLLFEFFTGKAKQNLTSSCRKVLKQYSNARRLKRAAREPVIE